LFEQQKKTPTGRRTEYSVLRPDTFVVSGMQGLKKFYVRALLKDSDVRGVTILYDQAMDGIMDPVVVAMSSAFAPFGGGAAMPGVKRNVEYATAIVANASGYLVADRTATEGCHIIVVPGVGNAERVAEDKEAELALLRVYGVGNLKAMALSAQPPRSAELTLIGIGDPQASERPQRRLDIQYSHPRNRERARRSLSPRRHPDFPARRSSMRKVSSWALPA
jgi:hypothetical protein